ncbi:hypothetical protein [Pseudolactococcus yaeyamensis]
MEKNDDYVLISNKYETNKLLYYNFELRAFYASELENFNPIFLIPLGSVILTRYLKLFETVQVPEVLFSYAPVLVVGVGIILGLILSQIYKRFKSREYSVVIISAKEVSHYLKDTKKMMLLFIPFLLFLCLLVLTYLFFFNENLMNLLTSLLLVITTVIFIMEFNFNKKRSAYMALKNNFKDDVK